MPISTESFSAELRHTQPVVLEGAGRCWAVRSLLTPKSSLQQWLSFSFSGCEPLPFTGSLCFSLNVTVVCCADSFPVCFYGLLSSLMTFGRAVNCIRKKATRKPSCSKAQSGLTINQDRSRFPSERDKMSSRATGLQNGFGLLMFTPPSHGV